MGEMERKRSNSEAQVKRDDARSRGSCDYNEFVGTFKFKEAWTMESIHNMTVPYSSCHTDQTTDSAETCNWKCGSSLRLSL